MLSRTFLQLKARFGAIFGVFDRVSTGLVLVSGTGQVVLANRAAREIFDSADGLRLSRGRCVEVADRERRAVLKEAVFAASGAANATGGRANRIIAVRRRSAPDPYLVEVSPLADADDEIGERFRGALLTIIDPDRDAAIELVGFGEIYGLSDAELGVARLCIEGLSSAEIAEGRSVSRETVRSQLRSIFVKTRVRNRTELVRRALRFSLPLDLS